MNKRIEFKDERRGYVYNLSINALQLRSTSSGNVQMFVGNEWRPVQGFTLDTLQAYLHDRLHIHQ